MRAIDIIPGAIGVGLLLFFAAETTRELYETAYHLAPLTVTFIKFALLATGGELLALRIRTGVYLAPRFGIVPKMLVWGILGVVIYAAFGIFAVGVPVLFAGLLARFAGTAGVDLLRAFLISVCLNILFAPAMMLTHHVTDRYIAMHSGRFPLTQFRLVPVLQRIDWERMWGVVFRMTIPLFWIPAHTVTFLLPEQFRTIFAAVLSVALGLILGTVTRPGGSSRGTSIGSSGAAAGGSSRGAPGASPPGISHDTPHRPLHKEHTDV